MKRIGIFYGGVAVGSLHGPVPEAVKSDTVQLQRRHTTCTQDWRAQRLITPVILKLAH